MSALVWNFTFLPLIKRIKKHQKKSTVIGIITGRLAGRVMGSTKMDMMAHFWAIAFMAKNSKAKNSPAAIRAKINVKLLLGAVKEPPLKIPSLFSGSCFSQLKVV